MLVGLALPRVVPFKGEIVIRRSPMLVYAYVASSRNYLSWAPWAADDPAPVTALAGPATGIGSIVRWHTEVEGAHSGERVITAAVARRSIGERVMLEHYPPIVGRLQLTPVPLGTKLDWSANIDTGYNPIERWRAQLNLKQALGGRISLGLSRLATQVERFNTIPFDDLQPELVNTPAVTFAYREVDVSLNSADTIASLRKNYSDIAGLLAANRIPVNGAPLKINVEEEAPTERILAALPVAAGTILPAGLGVGISQSYAGPAWRLRTTGTYPELLKFRTRVNMLLAASGLTLVAPSWEIYTPRGQAGEVNAELFMPIDIDTSPTSAAKR